MSVGSFEPRKNQLAVLHAAERLWREGHKFRLKFIGGGGWRTEFDVEMNRLAAAGRDVSVAIRISDVELWAGYRRARFSVFASLHEGYGLPVAESLAYGTPALTTDYGSTAEIAAEGGALTVDPRDDDALLDAMRRLLTDDALIAELEKAARQRPVRTWDDYARELWQVLAVAGPLQEERS
jgi:glycosyltransferase involved in cell wall biosynthesis